MGGTYGRTHDDSIYRASIASRAVKISNLSRTLDQQETERRGMFAEATDDNTFDELMEMRKVGDGSVRIGVI